MSSSGWNSVCPDFEEDTNKGASRKIASKGVATNNSAFLAIEAVAVGLSCSSPDAVVELRTLGENKMLRAAGAGDATTVNSKIPRSGQKK